MAPPPTVPGGTVDPAVARRTARDILRQPRYHEHRTPRPLRGVLRWVGDRLRPVFAPIGRALDRVFHDLPLGLIVTAALAVALVALTVWLVRRRGLAVVAADGERPWSEGGPPPDPRKLEAEADRAERDGDLERALRLRFLAGLVRLHRAGVLRTPVDGPNGELAATLGSDHFATLARTFDEVVYGRRPVASDDVDEARREWPAVLQEVGR